MTIAAAFARGALLLGALVGTWPAAAAILWRSDADGLTRIDADSAEVRVLAGFPRADALEPDADGGAWVRIGAQIVRVEPDLSLSLRVGLGAAPQAGAAMVRDPATRALWVAVGAQVLRFDDRLALASAWPQDARVRGIAVGGPRAIWVATDASLVQFDASGARIRAISLATLGIRLPVAGLLADPLRARLWLVSGTEVIGLDIAAEFVVVPRRDLPPAARAVAIETSTGDPMVEVDARWRRLDAPSTSPVSAVDDVMRGGSTGVIRLGRGATSPSVAPAVAGPVDLRGDFGGGERGLVVTARQPVEPTIGQAGFDGDATGVRAWIEPQVRCADSACGAVDAWLAGVTVVASIDGVPVSTRDVRWAGGGVALEIVLGALRTGAEHVLDVALEDAYGNRSDERRLVVVVGLDGRLLPGKVVAKALPVVSITSPANNATFVAPASMTIAAAASETGGTIAKIEFLRNGTLLATDTTAPFSYAWSGVAVGTYSLAAKAYDSLGGSTTSAVVAVVVKANVAPTVALTSPANGAAFIAPATVSLAATAADSDGAIAKVEFYNGTTRLATVTAAPYKYTWANVAGGSYSLTTKATDDKGAVTTSAAVAITVNKPPTVSLTAPANGAVLVAPVNITLGASAADADGIIAKVEFFNGAALLATDTTSPYSYVWSNVPVGSYTLTAKVTDNKGATTTSKAVGVTVNSNKTPTVTITSPANNATFVAPAMVPILATATDADGTVSKVEFLSGAALLGTDTTSPYTLQWNANTEGTFQLTARATDNKGGVTVSAPVTVTLVPNQEPTIALVGMPPPGSMLLLTAPTIHLTATASDPDGTVAQVRFYVWDEVASIWNPIATIAQPPYVLDWGAPPLGEWTQSLRFYAEAVDNLGAATASSELEYWVTLDRAPLAQVAQPFPSPVVFIAPATIVLVANAADYDIGIVASEKVATVQFLAGASVLASFTAPNGSMGDYVWVWRDPPIGTHTITVRATDSLGVTGDSLSATIRVVAAYVPTTIALTQPASGAAQFVNGALPLAATISGGGAPIARVDFINAIGSVVASAATPPYAASWTSPPAGRQAITAQAVDVNGHVTTSPTVFFVVPGVTIAAGVDAVVLTEPTALNTYPASVPIRIAAEVLDRRSQLARVEFYNYSALLGTATTAPYAINWSNPTSPTAILTAVAVDTGGRQRGSSPITVRFASNNASPSVAVTAPIGGASFQAPASIGLSATASDPDGTVAKIEYFTGSTLVGSATSPPYAATWSNVAAGEYAIVAKATDNKGAVTTSAAVTITVVAPAAIAITKPAANARFGAGQAIAVTAQASAPGRTISRVEFYADGALLGAAQIPGSVSAATATLNWTGAAVGSHVLSSKAVATDGYTLASSNVSITVSDLAVTLAEPYTWQTYVAPGDVRISASPATTGSAVARVNFYADGALLGSSTAAPYSWLWSPVVAGMHTVMARAVDAAGLTSDSPTVPVSVVGAPTIDVEPGVAGATIADDNVSLSGTVQAPANSAVIVDGQLASLSPDGRFFVNNLLLTAGTNTLTLVLNTQDAAPITRTITMTSTGAKPFQVDVDPAQGLAPLTTTLRIVNRGNVPFKRITIDTNGDGSPETTLTELPGGQVTMTVPYAEPGVYSLVVKVYDPADVLIYTATRRVLAIAPGELARTIVGVYRTFVGRLAANNPAGAVNVFVGEARSRYADVLDNLAEPLATIAGKLGTLIDGVVTEEWAELTLLRDTPEGQRVFMMYLIRGGDGIWRLESI
ncbi:MAG: Ig-like domain-containing protein [Betaproteobacteria bacterium]